MSADLFQLITTIFEISSPGAVCHRPQGLGHVLALPAECGLPVLQPLIWLTPVYFMGQAFSINGEALRLCGLQRHQRLHVLHLARHSSEQLHRRRLLGHGLFAEERHGRRRAGIELAGSRFPPAAAGRAHTDQPADHHHHLHNDAGRCRVDLRLQAHRQRPGSRADGAAHADRALRLWLRLRRPGAC